MTQIVFHHDSGQYDLVADRGAMRMILMGALADANLWARATGTSQETKNHWARRSTFIRGLLDQLPKPVNPRDPFEDLPGEPTPEDADKTWRERAAGDDARQAARKAASVRIVHEVDLSALNMSDGAAAGAVIAQFLASGKPLAIDPALTADDIEDLLSL